MTAALIVAALLATHAITFKAGGWWLRWTAYRHQIAATRTAITDPTHRAAAIAWHRRQLPRLHLPHLTRRRAA
ncbi:hypothetical protein ACFOOK_28280 [Micromonospora krabiensis]|uniref:Uncharacterized protein n=1 Tax=Micromonospora krabiensis TaxID=307121 RepID=A0A1C3N4L4_9ACTN|nr:hypothetical protein [Micromonospora krabiensis]SBV27532.1 hypothetical protein GA0070620_3056 [Micromonospora krabiensis]